MSTSYGFVDPATETLLLELLIQDLDELGLTDKGKQRADAGLTDSFMAIQLQKDILAAQKLTLSFENAAIAYAQNEEQIQILQELNKAEEQDRAAALALSRGHDLPLPTKSQNYMNHIRSASPSTSDETIVPDIDEASETEDEWSTSISTKPQKAKFARVPCLACQEWSNARSMLAAQCGHHYCKGCLKDLATSATTDETLFPLKCCRQELDLDLVQRFVSDKIYQLLKYKAAEFGTPIQSRIYCSNGECSVFLGSNNDSAKKRLACVECTRITCSECKQPSHTSSTCPENEATNAVRALAREEGWQICPRCNTIIELSEGCYHMTCRCRHEFCYLCAAAWKTCVCPQWDEHHIVNAARERVVNEFGARQRQDPVAFERRVVQAVQVLRENHECDVHSFVYRHGQGRCASCQYDAPLFLMRCTGCQLLYCKRCSYNRL